MGNQITKAVESISGNKKYNIIMTGLQCAGKTTIVYKFREPSLAMRRLPIISYVESFEYRETNWYCWDVGTDAEVDRKSNKEYYRNAAALIFVVDSNDRDRIDGDNAGSVKYELHSLLQEKELRDAVLLIWANKQDLPNAMDLHEIAARLELANITDRSWLMHASCATTGDGLYEGFDWVRQVLKHGGSNTALPQDNAIYVNLISYIDGAAYTVMVETRKKSILLLCGWIRNQKCKLKIPATIGQLILQFQLDDKINIEYDKSYSFEF